MKYVWLWIFGILALYMSVYTVIDFIKAYKRTSKEHGRKLVWPHEVLAEMSYGPTVWTIIVVVLTFFFSLWVFGASLGEEKVNETKNTVESTVDDTSADTISVDNTAFIGVDLVNNE